MCDTILAPPASTRSGTMLFGKNSDRQRNEGQALEFHAATDHAPGTSLRCTYLTIPQAARTHAVVISRPFWMWGAEMGANDRGVVVGNEAVHARLPANEEPSLLGDDLVRLALERADSAAEAVELITSLLGRYGQGGNNGHRTQSFFNNAFMIADAGEAFVLETVGPEWLLERVRGVRALSNRFSIATPDRTSAGLGKVLAEMGCIEAEPADFAEAIANPDREHIGYAGARRACTTALLRARDGHLEVADMMAILRDHGSGEAPHLEWAEDAYVRRSVCMHAGAIESTGQTTASMVSEIGAAGTHWLTATAAPCTSIFKPIFLDAFPNRKDLSPTGRFDPSQLWWRHEQIHRAGIAGDMARCLEDIRAERDALEVDFIARAAEAVHGDTADRQALVADCWARADTLEDKWFRQLTRWQSGESTPHAAGWRTMSKIAGMAEELAA